MMRGIIVSLPILLPLAVAGFPEPSGCTAPSGYEDVLFCELFSSPTLDTSTWAYDIGSSYPGGPPQWGTGEVQTYTSSPSNIFIADSSLYIVPRSRNGTWTSSRIETTAAHDFSCPEDGKMLVEGRVKLSGAPASTQAGIWPAFWLLGSAYRGLYTN